MPSKACYRHKYGSQLRRWSRERGRATGLPPARQPTPAPRARTRCAMLGRCRPARPPAPPASCSFPTSSGPASRCCCAGRIPGSRPRASATTSPARGTGSGRCSMRRASPTGCCGRASRGSSSTSASGSRTWSDGARRARQSSRPASCARVRVRSRRPSLRAPRHTSRCSASRLTGSRSAVRVPSSAGRTRSSPARRSGCCRTRAGSRRTTSCPSSRPSTVSCAARRASSPAQGNPKRPRRAGVAPLRRIAGRSGGAVG